MMRNRIDVAGYMNVEQMIIEINTSISVFRRTHKGAHRHTLVCTASRYQLTALRNLLLLWDAKSCA